MPWALRQESKSWSWGSLCWQHAEHTDVCPRELASALFQAHVVCPAGLGDGEVAPSTASAARTPALRAAELAAVCLQLYEAGGRTIHVPLPPDNGLIVIVREVLGKGSSSSAAPPTTKELKEQALLQEGACEVAQALLEMILQQHQQVWSWDERR